MPTYEYRCDEGHVFEEFQRMSDPAIEVCVECGAPARRVLHPVAVHFKGKGFYNTDYGTKKRQRELKESAEGTGKWDKGDRDRASDSAKANGTSSDSGSSPGDGGSSSKPSKPDAKPAPAKGKAPDST